MLEFRLVSSLMFEPLCFLPASEPVRRALLSLATSMLLFAAETGIYALSVFTQKRTKYSHSLQFFQQY